MLDAINTNKSSNQGCEWNKLFYLDEFSSFGDKKGGCRHVQRISFGKKGIKSPYFENQTIGPCMSPLKNRV
jgi:hypothetical protein